MKSLFMISFLIFLISCGKENVNSPIEKLDKKVAEVIQDIKALKDLTGQGLILQSVTPNEFQELNQLLLKTEAVSKRLATQPNDTVALNSLLTFYQKIKDFPFTDIDRSYFYELSLKLEKILVSYGERQGRIIGDLNRYQKSFYEDFEKGLSTWKQITEEGNNRLRFTERSFGKDFYTRISSFVSNGENLAGVQRLVSPTIKIDPRGLSEVQIFHAFRHYPNELHHLNLLSFHIRSLDDNWQEIILPTLPAGTSYDAEKSGFIRISDEFLGKEVEFSFLYKSTLDINPLWDIHSIEVRVDHGK